MSFWDIFLSQTTREIMSLGYDAKAMADAIGARDGAATSAAFLQIVHDGGQLMHVTELTDERLAKYQQGMALVTDALFKDVG